MPTKAEIEQAKVEETAKLAQIMEERESADNSHEEKEIPDIEEILGPNDAIWSKKRVQMGEIANRVFVLERAEYRTNKNGNYYILHLLNEGGVPATTTTGSPTIAKKVAALLNRGALPVRVRVVSLGNSYDLVSAKSATPEGVK